MKRSKITRIESWVNLGIPDCIVGVGNNFHLIELKVADNKGKVRISPHQIAFHAGHAGYPTWIMVQQGKGRSARLLLYRGDKAPAIMKEGVMVTSDMDLNYPWDWRGIEDFLMQSVDEALRPG